MFEWYGEMVMICLICLEDEVVYNELFGVMMLEDLWMCFFGVVCSFDYL